MILPFNLQFIVCDEIPTRSGVHQHFLTSVRVILEMRLRMEVLVSASLKLTTRVMSLWPARHDLTAKNFARIFKQWARYVSGAPHWNEFVFSYPLCVSCIYTIWILKVAFHIQSHQNGGWCSILPSCTCTSQFWHYIKTGYYRPQYSTLDTRVLINLQKVLPQIVLYCQRSVLWTCCCVFRLNIALCLLFYVWRHGHGIICSGKTATATY